MIPYAYARQKKAAAISTLALVVIAFIAYLYTSFFRVDYAEKVLNTPTDSEIESQTLLHLAEQLANSGSLEAPTVTDKDFFQLCDMSFDRLRSFDTGLFETMLNYCVYTDIPSRANFFTIKSLEYINAGYPKADHVLAELDARLHPINENDLELERLFSSVADERLLIALYMSLSDLDNIDRAYLVDLLNQRSDVRDQIKERFNNWDNQ